MCMNVCMFPVSVTIFKDANDIVQEHYRLVSNSDIHDFGGMFGFGGMCGFGNICDFGNIYDFGNFCDFGNVCDFGNFFDFGIWNCNLRVSRNF